MFNIFIEQFNGFLKFLQEKNIINTGIAFIMALQINKLFLNFIEDIITPVADKVISEKMNAIETSILGIKFRIGRFFISFLNFTIMMICIYFIVKVSETSPFFFDNIYTKIKHIF